jgi:hypothetical protein
MLFLFPLVIVSKDVLLCFGEKQFILIVQIANIKLKKIVMDVAVKSTTFFTCGSFQVIFCELRKHIR